MMAKPGLLPKWASTQTDPSQITDPEDWNKPYEDLGWDLQDPTGPSGAVFNGWQKRVGQWVEWLEGKVDDIVETVLNRWFVVVPGLSSVPNKTGIYKHETGPRFYLVHDNQMIDVGFVIPLLDPDYAYLARYHTWNGSQWEEDGTLVSASYRPFILQESASAYVTPKGLVDYFSVTGASYYTSPYQVPHQTGVYLLRSAPPQTTHYGVSIVVDNNQAYIPYDSSVNGGAYKWENGQWIQQ